MKTNETKEILTIAGKKVVVRYTRYCQPCEKCVFGESDNLCAHAKDKCVELDRVGMEIDERAYFVEAEQPEADLDAEIKMEWDSFNKHLAEYDDGTDEVVWLNLNTFTDLASHFAEWERKRTLDKVVEWMKANLTYTHPRKGVETCMVNIPAFLDAMNEENT